MEERVGFPRVFVSFILISIALIFLDILFPLTFIKEQGSLILTPMTFYIKDVSYNTKEFLKQFSNTQQVYHENMELKEENNSLKAEQALVEKLESENLFLKDQLKIESVSEYSKLNAAVIGKDSTNGWGTITVNRGSRDRVLEGMPVIIDNRLVGVIDDVYFSSSRVKLINSGNSSIPVKVLGDTDNSTLSFLEGDFGLQMKLVRVDQDAVIKQKDLIVTSGQGGTLPSNLLAGEVVEVFSQVETMLYQEGKISPLVNFEELKAVIIILEVEF